MTVIIMFRPAGPRSQTATSESLGNTSRVTVTVIIMFRPAAASESESAGESLAA